jgi:hypothetical protein
LTLALPRFALFLRTGTRFFVFDHRRQLLRKDSTRAALRSSRRREAGFSGWA